MRVIIALSLVMLQGCNSGIGYHVGKNVYMAGLDSNELNAIECKHKEIGEYHNWAEHGIEVNDLNKDGIICK